MTIAKIEKLLTTNRVNEFFNFLTTESNVRVVLSGKFGSGKTTFLKDFFASNDSFTPINLYPVNYSVAPTEDIFELIKYDILLQLLKWKDIKNYLVNIHDKLSSQMFHLDDPKTILLPILKKISLLDIKVIDVLSGIQELNECLENQTEEEKQELSNIIKLLGQDENIFESSIISSLISAIVDEFHTQNQEKKIVLVIDDLDRIDPEHIFRILNVFAAHNDVENEDRNKFGFDNIITVCDINNIKTNFHARYGGETDFTGYISKFYSKSVFHFDLKDEISRGIDNILSKILIVYEDRTTKQKQEQDLIGSYAYWRIKPVLVELILLSKVCIRQILQMPKLLVVNNGYYRIESDSYIATSTPGFIACDFFVSLFKDEDTLLAILSELSLLDYQYNIFFSREKVVVSKNFYRILSDYILIYDYKKIDTKPTEEKLSIEIGSNLLIYYQKGSSFDYDSLNILGAGDISMKNDYEIDCRNIEINIWDCILNTYKKIREIKQTTLIQNRRY